MRIVFMGTAEFAVPSLKNLILSGYDIALVVTQPDKPAGRGKKLQAPPVKQIADEYGLEIRQPHSIKTTEFAGELAEIKPVFIVVVAYGRILPETILEVPLKGCINLHGSLLPAYRGAAPIQRAIMAGETRVGVTTMYMDKTMDTGDIILQKAITLNGDEDYGQVSELLAREGADLLLDTLEQVEWGISPRIPQQHELATYAPPLIREDELIKWNLPARVIKDQIRALSPAPGAYTYWNKSKIKIYRGRVIEISGGMPGEVIDILPDIGFVVAAGDGGILVEEIQREGKSRMKASDFVRGSRIRIGDLLGQD